MIYNLIVALLVTLLANSASAATRIDLKHQSTNYIKPYFAIKLGAKVAPDELKEVKTDVDFNQTQHVRLQQMYAGIPVWGATSVIHTPHVHNKLGLLANLNDQSTMNGVIYEHLEDDLAGIASYVLSDEQKAKALQEAKFAFEKKIGVVNLNYIKESIKTIIYIDATNKAHYGFLVSFYYDDGKTGAHRPTAIMDAESLQIYHTWDEVIAVHSPVFASGLAGGIGGNEKSGEIIYDGSDAHFPALNIIKADFPEYQLLLCVLANEDSLIYDMSYAAPVVAPCSEHGNISWLSNDSNGTRWSGDEMNGGYSPSLDALYAATIVSNFYREWYGVPALVQEDGKTPMKLTMRVHYGRNFENAFWDGQQMTFGDGGVHMYPLTSLGIAAHEVSHGFTAQHSAIALNEPQMAALHEAFSDEAAVTMQYYATGKQIWDLGRDIFKGDGVIRYLDNPTQDGHSIDNLKDFDETEAHDGAGIFNKAFYLLVTTDGWDIRKAFNVMIQANMNYWTSSMTTLTEAACGVMSATRDYNYNLADVHQAFINVGIDTAECDTATRP